MSPSGHRRLWEPPVATALSIRGTAGLTGAGSDNFARQDIFHRPGIFPTAQMTDVGALPIPVRTETAKGSEADLRTWEAPVVTTVSL